MMDVYPVLVAAGAMLAVFFLAWVITASISDLTPLDSFWGLAPVAGAWAGALADRRLTEVELYAALLVSFWGVRLALYLIGRWRRHGSEDPRYASMRRKGGPGFRLRSLWNVVGLQAVLGLVVATPVFAALIAADGELTPLARAFAALAFVGALVEAIADSQLAAFKRNPDNAGKTLTTGLWALSRHPNYVGEIGFWLGLALFAATLGGWWSLVSPALVAFLLTKWSGAPLVERRMLRTRTDYSDYAARTGFFPFLAPKKDR